ncbi:MAG: class A beta-lactamase-related serine hydrolase [Patescibacteria group bacterium]|nr:class A beta-lactamase-related serine hydrolase [Patescibacteria group bacterium]
MRRKIHFILRDKIFYKKHSVAIVVVLVFSFIFNILSVSNYIYTKALVRDDQNFRTQKKVYPLLATRILLENPVDVLVSFLPLRNSLKNETDPWGDSFGMYFEYLPTGTSVNINGTSEFHAASLFKTPVVMAYFRTRERLNKTDDPTVSLRPEDLDSQFGNLWKKGAGYKIKLSEAVRLALEESDNTAARVLVPFIGSVDFEAVYQGLDINLNVDKSGAILTAKSYSSIFKALYFSSVLNKEDSQKILNYLSNSKFPDKIEAGVPDSVNVAHKIGDFVDKQGNEAFTDCGIIYVPRRPYLLCLVSKTDEQTARERMQDISKLIYDFVSSTNPPQKMD